MQRSFASSFPVDAARRVARVRPRVLWSLGCFALMGTLGFAQLAVTPSGGTALILTSGMTYQIPEDSVLTFEEVTVSGTGKLYIGGGSTITISGRLSVDPEDAVRNNNDAERAIVVCQGKNATAQVNGQWAGQGVTIHAANLFVGQGGTISADGQGYVDGAGPGGSGDTTAGGSHGGRAAGAAAKPAYGSAWAPVDLGSAGVAAEAGSSVAGGGAIHLIVDDTFTLHGWVTAKARYSGSGARSGAAGGSIWVETAVLKDDGFSSLWNSATNDSGWRGNGLFVADGLAGDAGLGTYTGGSGGRIAIYYRDASGFTADNFTNASVSGGYFNAANGSAVFVDRSVAGEAVRVSQRLSLVEDDSRQTFGRLTVDDGGVLELGGGATLTVAGRLSVESLNSGNRGASAILCLGKNTTAPVDGQWAGAGVTIRAGDLSVDAASSIVADGQGYANGAGPGGSADPAAGASYGGQGSGAAGPVYGAEWQPVDLGSASAGGTGTAPAGGGAIQLIVAGTFALDGLVTANGTGGSLSGSGAGGSIWVRTAVLGGAGRFTANGGVKEASVSGGGRIAVYYDIDAGFGGFASSQVNPAYFGATVGTLHFVAPPVVSEIDRAHATVMAGETASLSLSVSSSAALRYQWQRSTDGGATWSEVTDDGTFSGSTSATLTFPQAAWALNGQSFRCIVSDGVHPAVTTAAAAVTVRWSQFSAISARAPVGTGAQSLFMGFVYAGGGKPTVVRGVGPGLLKGDNSLPASEVLADPLLTLNELQTVDNETKFVATTSNDNWGGGDDLRVQMASLGMGVLDANSKDAVLSFTPTQTVYTAQVSGVNDTIGVALAEAYDADFTNKAKRFTALSVRNHVGTGAAQLIVGLVIDGDAPKKVIVRGVGPGLVPAVAVADILADPTLQVNHYTPTGVSPWEVVGTNDNWGGAADLAALMKQAGMGTLDANSKDAVLVLDLQPGVYTVQLTGVGDTTGIGLVEVYEAP